MQCDPNQQEEKLSMKSINQIQYRCKIQRINEDKKIVEQIIVKKLQTSSDEVKG